MNLKIGTVSALMLATLSLSAIPGNAVPTAAEAPASCVVTPLAPTCEFHCVKDLLFAVQAYGIAGGVLGDCGGRSAQCYIGEDGQPPAECSDAAFPLLRGGRGTCNLLGVEEGAEAALSNVGICSGA